MTDRPALQLDGPTAPPRKNGELVFESPWQSRVFGTVLATHERGLFEWDEFRTKLIDAIASREKACDRSEPFPYYECWLEAFERLSVEKGWLGEEAIDSRAQQLAARPAGHDHDH